MRTSRSNAGDSMSLLGRHLDNATTTTDTAATSPARVFRLYGTDDHDRSPCDGRVGDGSKTSQNVASRRSESRGSGVLRRRPEGSEPRAPKGRHPRSRGRRGDSPRNGGHGQRVAENCSRTGEVGAGSRGPRPGSPVPPADNCSKVSWSYFAARGSSSTLLRNRWCPSVGVALDRHDQRRLCDRDQDTSPRRSRGRLRLLQHFETSDAAGSREVAQGRGGTSVSSLPTGRRKDGRRGSPLGTERALRVIEGASTDQETSQSIGAPTWSLLPSERRTGPR